jgi:hypothetical protein
MNGDQQENIPKVFISYSHDSPQHKTWVAEFAAKLVDKGIDVTFDRWDLRRGGDVPKYMVMINHGNGWGMISRSTLPRVARFLRAASGLWRWNRSAE